MHTLQSFFQGKKVLLTGHTGFKGAWMLQVLNMFGATVKGISLAPEHENDLYNLIDGDTLCESVILDINKEATLVNHILEFQPDVIIHFAAQALVRRSYHTPVSTFATNVMGTVHIMEAMRKIEGACLGLMITTDKVYENNELGVPFNETDALGGYDPYSASKAACEIAISSYRNSFMHPHQYQQHQKVLTSVRAGNVIGGGDFSEDRIIPDIVRAIVANHPVSLRNPQAIRPWQHVLEPIFAYLKMIVKMSEAPISTATAYNIGPEPADALNVEQVTKMFIDAFGKGSYQIEDNATQVHEANLLTLDNTKIKTELNWQPKWNAHQAIEKTASWYAAVLEGVDAKIICTAQIHEYLN